MEAINFAEMNISQQEIRKIQLEPSGIDFQAHDLKILVTLLKNRPELLLWSNRQPQTTDGHA